MKLTDQIAEEILLKEGPPPEREPLLGRYPVLGSGLFSTVYQVSDTSALKLCRHTNDGSIHYLKYLQSTPHRPETPKIYSITETDEFYVAEMELLEKISDKCYWANVNTHGLYPSFRSAVPEPPERPLQCIMAELAIFIMDVGDDPNKYYPDIHSGNFMFRPSTEEFVLTDPLCPR